MDSDVHVKNESDYFNDTELILNNNDTKNKGKFKVEVPTLLVNFAYGFSAVVINNILLQRCCTYTLGNSDKLCLQIINSHGNLSLADQEIEHTIQKQATFILMTSGIICGLFPAVLSFFVGSWSDKFGRKPLILWPLFGLTITSMCMVIFSLERVLGPWWYVIASLPYSMCGGDSIYALGSYSILCDSTNAEARTQRLAILQVVSLVGYVLGCITSYYAYLGLGSTYLLLIAALFSTSSYFYANVFIDESLLNTGNGRMVDLFQMNSIRNTFSAFKSKENRAILILLIAINSINIFTSSGTSNLDYLFSRNRFHWTLKDFNQFSAMTCALWVLGSAFAVKVLQKVFSIQDATVLIIAYLSLMADGLLRLLSTDQWQYYFAGACSFMGGVTFPVIRSLLSKIVKVEEIGKMFAILSIFEAVLPVLSPAVFNILYAYTLRTFSGAIYLLSTLCYNLCFGMSIATYVAIRKSASSP